MYDGDGERDEAGSKPFDVVDAAPLPWPSPLTLPLIDAFKLSDGAA